MAKSFWNHCLIGSTVLHIGLCVFIKNMSPSTHTVMKTVDTFIVASCDTRLSQPERTILPNINTGDHAGTHEASHHQRPHQETLPGPLSTDRNTDVMVSPSQKAPDVSALRPRQVITPAGNGAGSAPASPFPNGPQEDMSGNKPSVPAHHNQGPAPGMMLGDAGAPRFIHRELPVYPVMARKLGKEGKVVLRLALDAQGKLQGIDTVESNGFGFADAASTAIRKSTFEPAVSNGRAVSSQVLVPIRFVLNEG